MPTFLMLESISYYQVFHTSLIHQNSVDTHPVSLDIIINRQSLASEAFTFMVPNGDPGGWNPLPDKTKLSKFNSFR